MLKVIEVRIDKDSNTLKTNSCIINPDDISSITYFFDYVGDILTSGSRIKFISSNPDMIVLEDVEEIWNII